MNIKRLRQKFKKFLDSVSIVFIVGFSIGIVNYYRNYYLNKYFVYKMYRLFFRSFSYRNLFNKEFLLGYIWTICLFISLLLSIFLIRRLCLPFIQSVFKFDINDKNKIIRLIFSAIISIFFFVYDGLVLYNCFIINKSLIIKILFYTSFLPITILLFFLFIQSRWEKLWGIILKAKNPILKSINIIPIIILLFVLCLNLLIYIEGKINIPKGPNIILISIDTLRSDHLGCYGYEKNITPNIDRFSLDGVLFKNCIVQAPATWASHASMLTSLVPVHHGLVKFNDAISNSILNIAEIVKDYKYNTISFNDGGFVAAVFGFDSGFDKYQSDYTAHRNHYFINKVYEFKSWIDDNKTNKYPFFVFLHTYEVHTPYTPFSEFLSEIENNYNGDLPDEFDIVEYRQRINDGELEIDSADLEHIVNLYDAEIMSMDSAFASLIDFLRKNNLYDNSLIIFTSDHGEEFGEHGIVGDHGHTLYDELLKVPLIIKFPNSQYGGRIIEQQVRSIDIVPTLLDWLNIKPIDYFEGVNLIPLINDIGVKDQLYAISQENYIISSIRTNRWKWYDYELFDLEDDPKESIDVSKENSEISESLRIELKNAIESKKIIHGSERKSRYNKEKLNKQLESQLKSLGYLQ